MSRPACRAGCTPTHFYVHIPVLVAEGEVESSELGILIDPETGLAMNIWTDGTVGVTQEQAELANEEDTVYCGECHESGTWVHDD